MAPLEGYEPQEWVVFERALVVRDLFTGGTRTFHSQPDARDFRAALYQQYGELPSSHASLYRAAAFTPVARAFDSALCQQCGEYLDIFLSFVLVCFRSLRWCLERTAPSERDRRQQRPQLCCRFPSSGPPRQFPGPLQVTRSPG